MKIILAGGQGFLGRVLCQHFAEIHEIIVLTRGVSRFEDWVKYEHWDAKNPGAWTKTLEGADVVINLTGRSVDCRYNEINKREILESRVDATCAIGKAISSCSIPPKLWINCASATIYRHSEDKQMDEYTGEIGSGFSVDVCKAWEKSFFDFSLPQTRQVAARISIILGKDGGAVKPLINLARFGLGGKQGSGKQFFTWMHQEDFARAIDFIIQTPTLTGPVNFAALEPTTNANLMRAIRKTVGVPFGLPMPKWLLEMGARIIKTETELIIKSRNVIPKKLIDAGFKHRYGNLDDALKQIVKS